MSSKQSAADELVSALPCAHHWPSRPSKDALEPLPGCAAVLLFVDEHGRGIQLATSQQLKRLAVARLTAPPETRAGRTDLAEVVRGVRWMRVHSAFEARWRYYLLARLLHPRDYRKRISFGPAWYLNLDGSRSVPEIRVTERIWNPSGVCVGPWPTQRACQQALDGLRDLFDLCRYPEQIRKLPAGQRCAYFDMGRCDAPCDGSAPVEPYLERTRSAWAFATGGVPAWIRSATDRMQQAAAGRAFERAGLIKAQLAFARKWHQQWAARLLASEEMNLLVLVPVVRRRAWKPFLFRQGALTDGPVIQDRKLSEDVGPWLAEQLAEPAALPEAGVRMEQSWLVAHFFNRKESAAAMIRPLGCGERVPEDLGEWLADAVAERREQSGPAMEEIAESRPESDQPPLASSDSPPSS